MLDVRILDGAMGTQLIDRGLRSGEPSILWNVTHPEDVRAVHQSYADAGAEAITTNTFGGSVFMLRQHGLEHRLVELNQAAVTLAKSTGRKVLGDLGPCGQFLEPLGDLTDRELHDAVRRQGEVLAEAGVDGFIVETMSEPGELSVTVDAVGRLGLPVFASFTYEKGPYGLQTMMGASPPAATQVAVAAGADAVGANCGTSLSLDDYLKLAALILEAAGDTPVLLQPNAGSPVLTIEGFRYDLLPREYGDWAQKVRAMGVRILGGCCGTTPGHIEMLR